MMDNFLERIFIRFMIMKFSDKHSLLNLDSLATFLLKTSVINTLWAILKGALTLSLYESNYISHAIILWRCNLYTILSSLFVSFSPSLYLPLPSTPDQSQPTTSPSLALSPSPSPSNLPLTQPTLPFSKSPLQSSSTAPPPLSPIQSKISTQQP